MANLIDIKLNGNSVSRTNSNEIKKYDIITFEFDDEIFIKNHITSIGYVTRLDNFDLLNTWFSKLSSNEISYNFIQHYNNQQSLLFGTITQNQTNMKFNAETFVNCFVDSSGNNSTDTTSLLDVVYHVNYPLDNNTEIKLSYKDVEKYCIIKKVFRSDIPINPPYALPARRGWVTIMTIDLSKLPLLSNTTYRFGERCAIYIDSDGNIESVMLPEYRIMTA